MRTCAGGTGGCQEKVSAHLLLSWVPPGALIALLPTPLLGTTPPVAGGGGDSSVYLRAGDLTFSMEAVSGADPGSCLGNQRYPTFFLTRIFFSPNT